jgi:hypothetical protein
MGVSLGFGHTQYQSPADDIHGVKEEVIRKKRDRPARRIRLLFSRRRPPQGFLRKTGKSKCHRFKWCENGMVV